MTRVADKATVVAAGVAIWLVRRNLELQAERPFLEDTAQGCRTFAASFLVLMRSAAPKMQCGT
jgi:hypothetical protein